MKRIGTLVAAALIAGTATAAGAATPTQADFDACNRMAQAKLSNPRRTIPRQCARQVAAMSVELAGKIVERNMRLAPLQGATLLVVDDDTDTRELLSMILQEAGADVTTAGSAKEGLAAFERQRPDVLTLRQVRAVKCPGFTKHRV